MTRINRKTMTFANSAIYRATLTTPSGPASASLEFPTIETACEWATQQLGSDHYTIADHTGSTVATGMLIKGADGEPKWNMWRISV